MPVYSRDELLQAGDLFLDPFGRKHLLHLLDMVDHARMATDQDPVPYSDGPVWEWFGLTYSSFAVLHRRILCSMPEHWQAAFCELLADAEERLGHHIDPEVEGYLVRARNARGEFVSDRLEDYRHTPPLEPQEVPTGLLNSPLPEDATDGNP